jgi:hypothetical protein
MRRPNGRTAVALALTAALLLALAVGGCEKAARPPDRDPDIIGVVENVTPAAGGQGGGSVLISATEPGEFTKASVGVTNDTLVLKREGDTWARTEFQQLRPRARVAAWFTGPVAESFPVQVAAEAVAIDY